MASKFWIHFLTTLFTVTQSAPQFEISNPGFKIPDLAKLTDVVGELCDSCRLLPPLESSGCNVSSTPALEDFSRNQIEGNWYLAYYVDDGLSQKLFTASPGIFSVSDVRFTVTSTPIFPTALRVFQCSTFGFLGDLVWRSDCPNLNFDLEILSLGVFGPSLSPLVKPVVKSLVPQLNMDQVQIRVIAANDDDDDDDDDDFLVLYGCELPLEDGTCAKGGINALALTRSARVSPSTEAKIRSIVETKTCVDFETSMKRMRQGRNLEFYKPEEEELWA